MEPLDDEFKQWVLDKAKDLSPWEMCQDDRFTCRLLNDVLWGRSKSFNRDSRKNKDVVGGLRFLEEEYTKEKNLRRDDNG